MGDKCNKCGHDINDRTVDCPGCGCRILEARLVSRVAMLADANKGWRATNAQQAKEIERLRAELVIEQDDNRRLRDELVGTARQIEIAEDQANRYLRQRNAAQAAGDEDGRMLRD